MERRVKGAIEDNQEVQTVFERSLEGRKKCLFILDICCFEKTLEIARFITWLALIDRT
jgi:hypothetical protein